METKRWVKKKAEEWGYGYIFYQCLLISVFIWKVWLPENDTFMKDHNLFDVYPAQLWLNNN